MKAKRLKELLTDIDDDLDIFIRNSHNLLGNISDLEQVEVSTYGFFGESLPCLIFNTEHSKEVEVTENDDVIDYIETCEFNRLVAAGMAKL